MRAYRVGNAHTLTIKEIDTGIFSIRGDLTFATINKTTLAAINWPEQGQTITIDLQAVTATDSAGLALMIEWTKHSKKNNCTLNFTNIPVQLQALAKISGVNQNLQLTLPTHHSRTQR